MRSHHTRTRRQEGSVIVRPTKHSGDIVWLKYRDANGDQTWDRLGPVADWPKAKARVELARRVEAVNSGYVKPERVSFPDFGDIWYEEAQRTRQWKPRSVRANADTLKRLKNGLGAIALTDIDVACIDAYTATALEKGYAPKTVLEDLVLLGNVLKMAQRKGLVTNNAATLAERPKVKRRKWRILRPEEAAAVARAFTDDRYRLAFLMLMRTGLRRHELLNLRWRDVHLDVAIVSDEDGDDTVKFEPYLRVIDSKTEDGVRSVALDPRYAERLLEHRWASPYKSDSDFVFAHPRSGNRMYVKGYVEQFQAACAAVGIEEYVRPFHDLRHASLTNGAGDGEDSIELMTRAGHASMQTTKIYLHLAGKIFPDAAQRRGDAYGLGD